MHNSYKHEDDLRDVVIQMNKFRVALVCNKINNMLQNKVKTTKLNAMNSIIGHAAKIKQFDILRE